MTTDPAMCGGVMASVDLIQGDFAMVPTLQSLGIDRLSVAERILLVEEIWDSIAKQEEELAVTEVQKDDLHRRVAAYEADPNAGSSWEAAKARLRENR